MLGVRKVKAHKKMSMRQRLRLEGVNHFGKQPYGQRGIRFDRAVDRFIREGSCRHRHCLGSPCVFFGTEAKAVCKLDGHICDLLTAKGERYRLEYE